MLVTLPVRHGSAEIEIIEPGREAEYDLVVTLKGEERLLGINFIPGEEVEDAETSEETSST